MLAGVRPEEAAEWHEGPAAPVASLSFAASPDAQAQAIEQAIEQGRRVAARGGDAVVLADTLEYLSAGAARRALAAARNIAGGGSLTVIATAATPLGGETTVVALDEGMTALGRFPALDLTALGHAAPGAAGRRRRRPGDRQGARRGREAPKAPRRRSRECPPPHHHDQRRRAPPTAGSASAALTSPAPAKRDRASAAPPRGRRPPRPRW